MEIIGNDGVDEAWFVIHEDELVEMIQLAFNVPWFRIDNLIDVFQQHKKEENGTRTN